MIDSNRRQKRGSAMLEFAITLPLLLGLCMAATDFGRLFYHAVTVSNAAGVGAFYGARDAAFSGDFAGQEQVARNDMRNITAAATGAPPVTVDTVHYCTCPDAANPGQGGNKLLNPLDPVNDPYACNEILNVNRQCSGYGLPRSYVAVTVNQPFPLLGPWPMLPANTQVARTAFQRIR